MHIERVQAFINFLKVLPEGALDSMEALTEVFEFTPEQMKVMDAFQVKEVKLNDVVQLMTAMIQLQENSLPFA